VRAAATTVVDRPREVVWQWAADPRNWENWQEGVRDVRVSGRLVAGARIASRYEYGGGVHEFEYELVEREPPRRQLVRSLEGPFSFQSELELREHARGTLVRQTVEAGPDSRFTAFLYVLLGPFLRRGLRRRIEAQLRRLKEAIELTGVR
jgi:polyketide cyclase/dehydrase/lipid transport protein